ncbi:hypothetical protein ACJMK2_028606 [Sinanodonta woodiana]|uniref:Cornifelin n=1 Tax=Sinanodonta woodiana TaxID=1069815 RepID=A0ABD3X7N0_SINWO
MQAPITSQPMVVGNVMGHREWSTGLFDCFSDCGTCLMGYFCLPCTMCTIASKQGDCACMPFCVPGAMVALRARIRTLGGIRGSICNDCLVMSFCGGCAVCQLHRELNNMGL